MRYFVDGIEVGRDTAVRHWLRSKTFRMAKDGDSIWVKAEKGIDFGGVANHLREAGITISPDEFNAEAEKARERMG